MDRLRRWHRSMGFLLILPFLGWAATGLVFFIKPGYSGAYDQLTPKTYGLESTIHVEPDNSWRECRTIRTVLGVHLLVKTPEGWRQRDPKTLQSLPLPDEDAVRRLVQDAIAASPNASRYGAVTGVDGTQITTEHGVSIDLNWNNLTFYQRGPDTRLIDTLYDVHYLRWTGLKWPDRVLGFAGLLLLTLMTFTGIRLLLNSRRAEKNRA